MEEIIVKVAIGISIAVISSVITSLVTFHLTSLRFRNEKIWELKAKAYQDIIETLSDSSRCLHAFINHDKGYAKPDKSFMEELIATNDACHAKIKRAIDIGSFLLSEDAANRLVKYEKACAIFAKSDSNHEFLNSVSDETRSCMEDLKVLAKQDLKS